MSVTTDIAESWRRPRVVVRRLLAQGRSEPFAFSLLLTFLVIVLVAQVPNQGRLAYMDDSAPVAPRILALAMGVLATLPVWYLLAAMGTLISRLFGLGLSFYGGRIALFWALLAASPAMLAQGLVLGLAGPGAAASLLGLAILVAFLAFWTIGLREAGQE